MVLSFEVSWTVVAFGQLIFFHFELAWAGGGLVFHRADGQPLYQTWLNQQHSALRTLLKTPADFVPHSFRHTYGTRLGETGADAFTIMKLMGHSTVTVSQRYVHPSPEAMENAITRLEAWNTARRSGVGTNIGTSAVEETEQIAQAV